MEFTTLLPNSQFLRDGEQEEFVKLPMANTEEPIPPTPIRLGRNVRIGRNVKLKPAGT